MPVIYNAAVKTARMTAARDQVAGGSLEITTSADAVLVAFPLTTAGGSVSGNVWTIAYDSASEAATGAGAAAKARIKDSGGTVRISGLTVGTSGADVTIDNVTIEIGQTVNAGASTITHAPDPS
jgi:hypothetical protein